MDNKLSTRVAYLDWLRCFAIIGVLLFHAARPYQENDPWHINFHEYSPVLTEWSYWLSRFRMPLLFFISGAVAWHIVKKYSAKQFVLLRFQRLFIPVVAGIFIIVPPQIYMERLANGYQGNFWDFYPKTFDFKPYPQGNTSWHHLWFIVYLFVYDLVLAPFFAWTRTKKAAGFIRSLAFFAKGKRIYLLCILPVAWYAYMVPRYDMTGDLVHDYCFVLYWFFFVLIGFLCMLQPLLLNSMARNRRFHLSASLLLMGFICYIRWNDLEFEQLFPGAHAPSWTYLYIARIPLVAWCWIFALVGYAKTYLNKPAKAFSYINPALYPFYILHQTVIVIIAYYLVQTEESIALQYIFLTVTSGVICLLIYHLFIQPYNVTRVLFGMKPMPRIKKSKQSPVPKIVETAIV